MYRYKRGQVFLLAGFLLAALFAAGLSATYSPRTQGTRWAEDLARNIEHEAPIALNFGLAESSSPGDLSDFMRFVSNYTSSRSGSFQGYWAVAVPSQGSVTVYIGNHLGEQETFAASVDGIQGNFTLYPGSYSSNPYMVASDYSLRISYPGYSKNLSWSSSKANLYLEFSIADGANTIKRSIEA